MKYLIANWKSHKNLSESSTWWTDFLQQYKNDKKTKSAIDSGFFQIIICPPFPLLQSLSKVIKNVPNCHLGAQDVSAFPEGSYTGEVSAESLSELAEYVIIGHSERRKYFAESDELIATKNDHAQKHNMHTIVCIRNNKDRIPTTANIIAYEPVEAIGSGKNAAPAEVDKIKKTLDLKPEQHFLYGGSVDGGNCDSYTNVDGFLVGTASLDAQSFLGIATALK